MPASLSRPARSVVVDLAEDASVAAATARVGAVDGVVFLAGVLWPTRAHDRDAAKVTAICTVTFTGCARVLGAVVPEMVARGSGHGVIAGSLSGFRGLTGAIGYAASKAGSMAEAESMYCDLRGSGGKVQRANPGFIRTRLTDKNDFLLPFLMEPQEAAGHMLRLMRGYAFKSSFAAVFSWRFRLSQFLPAGAYYRNFAPKGQVGPA